MNKVQIFTNGLVKENPVLRLVLGTCPTLAVTTMAFNGLGMGIAATFVLFCSNIAISLLRNVIPDKVRLPAYITVIATFVSIVQMLVKAYVPAGRVPAPDRCELHHPGPCRDVRFQEQASGLCSGRSGHGPGLHPDLGTDGLHP